MCQGVFVVFAVTAPWYTSKPHTQHPLPLEPAPSSREQQQQQHLCRLSQRGKGAEPPPARPGLSHCPALREQRHREPGEAPKTGRAREGGSEAQDPDPIPTTGN